MTQTPSVPIYDYQDYRQYLTVWFQFRKSLNRHFSHRIFAQKAGIKSSGYFMEVASGIRNLTPSMLPLFAKALELDAAETKYLERLAAFNHARTDQAKQVLYEQMIRAMPPKVQHLRLSQMEYFTKWYYVAVRECLSICAVKEDYEPLAARLNPRITAAQAKAAVRVLSDLGLVEKDAEGIWRARHASLKTRSEVSALLVRAFQAEMMARARESLEAVPQEQRDISTVTMSLSDEGMDRIKAAAEEFRKRVREIVQSDKGENRVAQLNIQLFPLTRANAAQSNEA